MRKLFLLACFTALASAAFGASPPLIDGLLDEEEWKSAPRQKLSGGGELRMLRVGDDLYLAVSAANPGIASFCIADGNRVEILHASAALGTAVYERGDGGWRQLEGFDWKVREGAPEDSKKDYLHSRGWLANSSRQASLVREYRITNAGGDRRLAVVFLHTDEPMSVARWPDSVDDDCASVRLAQGYSLEATRFDPSRWARLSELP
jgi:hypothetical protein